MIYTKSGVWVRSIVWYDHATGQVEFCCRHWNASEEWRTSHFTELRADGGLPEILDSAIEQRNRPR